MFEIINRKDIVYIRLSKGNSCEIETTPFCDADNNKIYDPDKNDKPIMLGENDYILFVVTSGSGRKYLTKIITNADYNEQQILTLKLKPVDTLKLEPHCYNFSFTYLPNAGEDAYTYAEGKFELLPVCGTVEDLPKKGADKSYDTEKGDVNVGD